MPKPNKPDPERSQPTATFADVTKEIARRNDEAQKAARAKRAARERQELALRQQWERL